MLRQSTLPGVLFWAGVLYAAHAQTPYRYPSADIARNLPDRAVVLDTYKFRQADLTCILPDGVPVAVIPVSDRNDFSFLAVKSRHGLGILANERVLRSADWVFSMYMFYRECGLHAVADVKTTSPYDEGAYPGRIVKMAECLAVIPTQKALPGNQTLPYSRISRGLHDVDPAHRGSTTAELARCSKPAYVSNLAKDFRPPARR